MLVIISRPPVKVYVLEFFPISILIVTIFVVILAPLKTFNTSFGITLKRVVEWKSISNI